MCYTSQRHSIFCILPPHVLRSIAQRGNAEQRTMATNTLAVDATLRAFRASAQTFAAAPSVEALANPGEKRRTIYTASHSQQLPGQRVRGEGDPPSGDVAVNEAYEGLGATWDFFWNTYGRNSIDDEGMALDATVHFGQAYNNAFWNSQQMVFGDGDGQIFNRFTISLDVIGHELAHGVTEDESQLAYLFQPGALNESLSDVFGSLVKQQRSHQTAKDADWLIGEGLLAPGIQGIALRSMKEPGSAYDDPVLGKDPQPAHMKQFVHTYEDNGGVHINSGIPNHAFYLASTRLGGYAWEKAGRIWYETLRDSRLRTNSGFKRFATLTAANASRLFGTGSVEHAVVISAWQDVGVAVSGGSPALVP
jgi:Zn-dependent metalloprotease